MSDKRLLHLAGNPRTIKKLSFSQMQLLASEVREQLIETVSKTGGHLSSNLGTVELTLALMHCFDLPDDKIIWDVGHQCYTYKMLTGRLDRFDTIRQKDGISGFPKTAESVYDSFISGHASTSLAVAYGYKCAMDQLKKHNNVVAIIGDGSLTGGMAYEGLNNIGKSGKNLIIILNDNEMAISKNEGAIAKYLSAIRSTDKYFMVKDTVKKAVLSVPKVGKPLNNLISESKTIIKQAIYPSTFFEELGFTYFGPLDGHNIKSLCDVLTEAKKTEGPSIIHIKTQKGKGYTFAEKDPGAFHGVSSFNISTGKAVKINGENFSSVFGKELARLAENDNKICAITAAMESGTGLNHYRKCLNNSDRFYDVGIAEEFGVTFASALSAGGTIPVFAVYSTFLQRAYDQLIHDASIEKRHIVIGIDRAGIVGDDGETHQGIFDAAFLSTIPGTVLYAPSNFSELKSMLNTCIYKEAGIAAIRYPRGGEDSFCSNHTPTGNNFDVINNDGKKLVVTYGRTFSEALKAAEISGDTDVMKLNRILPIDNSSVDIALKYDKVIFVEEGIKNGGIAIQFMAELMLKGYNGDTAVRAIEGFVAQNSVKNALSSLKLDAEGIAELI